MHNLIILPYGTVHILRNHFGKRGLASYAKRCIIIVTNEQTLLLKKISR